MSNKSDKSAQIALKERHCVPCTGAVPALTHEQIQPYLRELDGWELVEDKCYRIKKHFTFPNFKTALRFVNVVGDLAEYEGHHPDIHLSWGSVVIDIWTHKINGLSESDFILAAKIDVLS